MFFQDLDPKAKKCQVTIQILEPKKVKFCKFRLLLCSLNISRIISHTGNLTGKLFKASAKPSLFRNPSLREDAGCIWFKGFLHSIGGRNANDFKFFSSDTVQLSSKDIDSDYLPDLPRNIDVSWLFFYPLQADSLTLNITILFSANRHFPFHLPRSTVCFYEIWRNLKEDVHKIVNHNQRIKEGEQEGIGPPQKVQIGFQKDII